MDDPNEVTMPYIDALVAFWPGLQVLTGDLKSAITYHQVLYHIVRRNNFIPEAFRENMEVIITFENLVLYLINQKFGAKKTQIF